MEQPERWVAAALASWHNTNPDKFPGGPSWRERNDWRTPAEISLAAQLNTLEDELRQTVETIQGKKLEIIKRQQEEFTKVNEAERRLITAQGDDLVEAVQASLEEIGFAVQNVDREIADKGDRREDLRIRDPGNPDWVVIAEVRGYKRGAQLNDLLRIARLVTRFVSETGKKPSASWYIVNHNFGQDPAIRPDPLVSNPSEVRTFAEDGGLVIDSRYLFRVTMDVRSGLVDPAAARAKLITSTGTLNI